jgi:NADH dehydrogenase
MSGGDVSFAYLVIALGLFTSFKHAASVGIYAVRLKVGSDAVFLRNRALTMLEWAEIQRHSKACQELLTFVVAGGGFSEVEGIATLVGIDHGARCYYPSIMSSKVWSILASSGAACFRR